jgi:hypothetical protein
MEDPAAYQAYKPFEYWVEEQKEIPQKPDRERFISAWEEMQAEVHQIAVDHGWWKDNRPDGEIVALIHSELSECLEACRTGYPPDTHCPHHGNAEVELADAVIRIMDFSAARGWDIASALADKVAFNEGRPYKHGKSF